MYTQCPDCATSFRVTAEVLKVAAGKVRCGGCGNAFNALEYLSESKPEAKPAPEPERGLPELKPDPYEDTPEDPPPAAISPEQSAALLKTLDELAGDDIRLEDTGIEWRLMAEDDDDADEQPVDEMLEASPTPVDQFLTKTPNEVEAGEVFEQPETVASDIEIIGEEAETPGDELRFDDNTGLPEDFDFDAAPAPEPAPAPAPAAPEPHPQADLALGDPDEWSELLSEAVIEPEARPDDGPSIIEELEALEAEISTDAEASEARASGSEDTEGDKPLDIDTQFDLQAEALGLDFKDSQEPAEEAPELAVDDEAPVADAPSDAASEPDPTETSIEDDLIAAAFEAEQAATAALEASGIQLSLDDEGDEEESILDDLTALDDDGDAAASIDEELSALDDSDAEDVDPFADDEPSIADELIGRDAVYGGAATSANQDFPDSTGALEFEIAEAAAAAEKDDIAETAPEITVEEPESEASEEDIVSVAELADETDEPPPDEDDIAAELALLDDVDNDEAAVDEDAALSEDLAEAAAAAEHVVPPPSEEEQTINAMIDQDLMRLAIEDEEGFASTIVFQKQSKSGKRDKTGEKSAESPPDVADEAAEPEDTVESPDAEKDAQKEDSFETIIMEGSFARTAEEQERIDASTDEETGKPAFLAAAEAENRGSGGSVGRRVAMIGGVVVLLLGLGGQFVHQSRAELATVPAINNVIGPIYRTLGMPITPEWDVSGWRFEVTRGSTGDFAAEVDDAIDGTENPIDGEGITAGEQASAEQVGQEQVDEEQVGQEQVGEEQVGREQVDEEQVGEEQVSDEQIAEASGPETLTIYSRIGNQSSQPLPYPLVSVSLTDRFEETIGNVVLEPAEYLTGDFDPRRLVPAGETFDAVISIESPSMEATGFKLNVCYRQDGGLLRCAIEDFK